MFVLTPEGKLARYFYGIEYRPRDVRLGLVEASQSRIGTPVDTLMLYCYHYDPRTGKYGPVVMNIMKVAGAITIGLIAGMLLMLRKRGPRKDAALALKNLFRCGRCPRNKGGLLPAGICRQ